ncbi:hypothetical protein FJZ53_01380 [Candidatus Woesearchaeota archaeon]|nr:hypothetical protein [Candidatus Woesearchaeota archaeon]
MKDKVLEELKRIYSKVTERLPELKKEELSLRYSENIDYVIFLMVDEKKFLKENKIVISPSITVGLKFLTFTEEEKESAVSHELGHYCRYKRSSPVKVEKSMLYVQVLNAYAANPKIWVLEEMDYEIKHKIGRVKKWHYMQEMYADNKAFEAGYGQALLNVLKNHIATYHDALAPVHKKELNLRINNLEEKLKAV